MSNGQHIARANSFVAESLSMTIPNRVVYTRVPAVRDICERAIYLWTMSSHGMARVRMIFGLNSIQMCPMEEQLGYI